MGHNLPLYDVELLVQFPVLDQNPLSCVLLANLFPRHSIHLKAYSVSFVLLYLCRSIKPAATMVKVAGGKSESDEPSSALCITGGAARPTACLSVETSSCPWRSRSCISLLLSTCA